MTRIRVTVVAALPDRTVEIEVDLPAGATVAEALVRSGIDAPPAAAVGIYGLRVARDTVLGHGDRVEVYRPLLADPKAARRGRASRGRGA